MDTDKSESARRAADDSSHGEIVVRADEVDEAGTDISPITSNGDEDLSERVEARRQQDLQNASSPKPLANAALGAPKPPVRPILRRDTSALPPPKQPPPPAPPQQQDEAGNAADSLTLAQLKDIVKDLPKLEPVAYAYTYEDTRSLPEELEEWFQYTEEDRDMLSRAEETFEEKISAFDFERLPAASTSTYPWLELPVECRDMFVTRQLADLALLSPPTIAENLEAVAYIALGVWKETAWLKDEVPAEDEHGYEPPNDKYRKTDGQLKWIVNAAEMLCRLGTVPLLYDIMRHIYDNDEAFRSAGSTLAPATEDDMVSLKSAKDRQMNAILTILYFLIESGRHQVAKGQDDTIRRAVAALEPNVLHYLSHSIANLRWDETANVPLTKMILLLWKSILLLFGGTRQLAESKEVLDAKPNAEEGIGGMYLTASPLDYHIFRQEITSKYPAYNPPPPLVPLEPNNSSILPPLPNHPSRSASQDSLFTPNGIDTNGVAKSIFHQPVHISTPAPSPPPSPAGPGGKGGKKQNYQTNQNFPFLYPPLDDTTNNLDGKRSAGLQDTLVGKRWEGSDVPASILEAGQLFASRMRMSRSLQQLWSVREDFIKAERGWDAVDNHGDTTGVEMDFSDTNIKTTDSENGDQKPTTRNTRSPETNDEAVQTRLDAVEKFYRSSLPHLQSIVIVLLKVVLSNVSTLVSQANGTNATALSFDIEDSISPDTGMPAYNVDLFKQIHSEKINLPNGHRSDNGQKKSSILEDLNLTRLREITSKAVAGIILMLLKWFKLSHILKFEYLTQLLLDSNYMPLALKYFAHQDVDRAVDQKNNREALDFFRFCHVNAGRVPTPPPPLLDTSSSSSSEDEAQPPPIARARRSQLIKSPPASPRSSPSPPRRPEVDELGYPITALPTAPLTTYAPRYFYTTITHLRILQKLTKRKAHRALLLVQYKSSTILRRALKIPQPSLRLYTLKLFKSQVPYCGRKWRQTNMRVITAIYLHCKPELRDEWISGGNVEEAVEEAVPLEQAGRALVHWWHLRTYREAMGVGKEEVGEADFFVRELERMGWGVGGEEGREDRGEEGEWEGW